MFKQTMRRRNLIQWAKPRQPSSDYGDEQDVVVWVSVPALDAAWMLDINFYIEPGGKGAAIEDRYNQFGVWFMGSPNPLELPVVGIEDGIVSFTDGRHRFAWLRDHGMLAIPVQVLANQAYEFEQRFGVTERTSLIQDLDLK
ncbi:MAG: hypothetical protein ACYC43_02320 [Burkholderiales bacterium]